MNLEDKNMLPLVKPYVVPRDEMIPAIESEKFRFS